MTTKAKTGRGVRLQRGDGGGTEVFTTIGEVKNWSGPSESVSDIEATSMDSTAKEFIADLAEPGEVTATVNFVGSDAQQQGLRTDLRAGTLRNFKLIFNDHATTPTTAVFSALVTGLDGPSGSSSEIVSMDITLKVSGSATWTYSPT